MSHLALQGSFLQALPLPEPSRPLGVWPRPSFSLVSYTPQTGQLHSPDSSACTTCTSALLSQSLAMLGTRSLFGEAESLQT